MQRFTQNSFKILVLMIHLGAMLGVQAHSHNVSLGLNPSSLQVLSESPEQTSSGKTGGAGPDECTLCLPGINVFAAVAAHETSVDRRDLTLPDIDTQQYFLSDYFGVISRRGPPPYPSV